MKHFLRNLLLPKVSTNIDAHTYPKIPPVAESQPRPFWSVMIPTYNRPNFLKEALVSVLEQGIGPDEMQIAVVDNASTIGDIKRLVNELGSSRIEYYRQPEFVDAPLNWSTCLQQARGYWVHLLHDDDLVLPGFYERYRRHINEMGCKIIFSQVALLNNESGEIVGKSRPIQVRDEVAIDPYELIWKNDSFSISSLVASRELYEQIGGYNRDMYFAMDLEMSARLFAHGRVGFIMPPVLALRFHNQQESRVYWRKKEAIYDVIRACRWLELSIPSNKHSKIYDYASLVTRLLSQALEKQGYKQAALRHAVTSFRLMPSRKTVVHVMQILFSGQPYKLYRKIRSWLGRGKRKFQKTLMNLRLRKAA
jgi:GT2 family glycosyltransferase